MDIFSLGLLWEWCMNRVARRLFIDLNLKRRSSTVLVSGMGRSGTTWLSEIINYDNSYRDIFEPFWAYRVRAARTFRLHHYIRPDDQNPTLAKSARSILTGKIRSKWTDQNNRKLIGTKRIIKDVRTNLMLKWLHGICPGMPIILLIRHPLAVVSSWRKLQWGIQEHAGSRDFEQAISQADLLQDFPIIANGLKRIDCDSYFDKLVFLWCMFYYVPLKQLDASDYLFVSYERLLLSPEKEFARVFSYLKRLFDSETVLNKVQNPSTTNFHKINFVASPGALVQSWKNNITSIEIARTHEILQGFGLDELYDSEGFPMDQNQ
jgi:hypothetical protein